MGKREVRFFKGTRLLLYLAQHSSSDVRVLAKRILADFIDLPLRLEGFSVNVLEELPNLALSYCNSPKEIECDTGASLLRLVLLKYTVN